MELVVDRWQVALRAGAEKRWWELVWQCWCCKALLGGGGRWGCVLMAYDIIDPQGRLHAAMMMAAAVGAARWRGGSA